MAIKRIKYKGREITCPHGNIFAEIDGRVAWVSPQEAKRQNPKPAKKPDAEPQDEDQGDDQDEQDEGQGTLDKSDFWGSK